MLKCFLALILVCLLINLPILIQILLKISDPEFYGYVIMNKEVNLDISFKELQYLGLTTTVLLLIIYLTNQNFSNKLKITSIIFFIILTIYILTLGLFDAGYFTIFSYNFSTSALETILETNSTESFEFITHYIIQNILYILEMPLNTRYNLLLNTL